MKFRTLILEQNNENQLKHWIAQVDKMRMKYYLKHYNSSYPNKKAFMDKQGLTVKNGKRFWKIYCRQES